MKKIEEKKAVMQTGETAYLLEKTRGLSKAGRCRVLEKMKENGYDEFENRQQMAKDFKKNKMFIIDRPYRDAITRYDAAHRQAFHDLGHELEDTKAMPEQAAMRIQGPKQIRPHTSAANYRDMDPPSLSYLKLKSTHGAHFPRVKPRFNFFQ